MHFSQNYLLHEYKNWGYFISEPVRGEELRLINALRRVGTVIFLLYKVHMEMDLFFFNRHFNDPITINSF